MRSRDHSKMAEAEGARSLSGLLSGIAQRDFHHHTEVTEELLREQLYPQLPQEDFKALHDKMTGLLKSIATANMDHAQLEAFLTAQTKRQGGGRATAEQAAALSRFWKSQRARVRESLQAQSRWEPGLRGVSWRVDLQAGARQGGTAQSGPVALMELELGRTAQNSEFVCLEFDEAKVNQVLKKMADIQASIDRVAQRT